MFLDHKLPFRQADPKGGENRGKLVLTPDPA